MSTEVPKTVEEPVVAPAAATAPVVAATEHNVEPSAVAAAVIASEAPAAAEPVAATETTPAAAIAAPAAEAEEVKETKPVEEGILGYKAPGLLKSFMFSKKFFHFGAEPVEHKHLSSYLRGEKPEAANHNAAWAAHTGKGLLFFSKKASEKSTPAGVINLSEVSDVTPEGTDAFFFTLGGHKHTFEAANAADRDNWVSTLTGKVAEAKELAPTVTESEKYKDTHSALSKPAGAAAAVAGPRKSAEAKKEEKAEEKEAKKEEKAEAKEEKKEEKAEAKKSRTSRSASRKRASIFGALPGFGKKEDKVDEELPAAAAAAPAPATETAVEVPAAEPVVAEPVVAEPAVAEAAPAVAEPAVAAPAEPVAAAAEEPVVAETKPAATKRNSIFGTLQSRFSQPKVKKEDAPVAAVKDEPVEPIADAAPVIPAPEATEPLAAAVASPATVPATETGLLADADAKVDAPVFKSDKRKSSLPWLSKKDKVAAVAAPAPAAAAAAVPATEAEPVEKAEKSEKVEKAEKTKSSPFAKLRGTVKGFSGSKTEKAEKVPESTETAAAAPEPAAAATATETSAVEAPATTAVATEAAPVETTAAAAPATTSEAPVVSEPVSVAPASAPQVSATA